MMVNNVFEFWTVWTSHQWMSVWALGKLWWGCFHNYFYINIVLFLFLQLFYSTFLLRAVWVTKCQTSDLLPFRAAGVFSSHSVKTNLHLITFTLNSWFSLKTYEPPTSQLWWVSFSCNQSSSAPPVFSSGPEAGTWVSHCSVLLLFSSALSFPNSIWHFYCVVHPQLAQNHSLPSLPISLQSIRVLYCLLALQKVLQRSFHHSPVLSLKEWLWRLADKCGSTHLEKHLRVLESTEWRILCVMFS